MGRKRPLLDQAGHTRQVRAPLTPHFLAEKARRAPPWSLRIP